MKIFNRKYKFTDKKISRGGIVSSLFVLIAVGMIYAAVNISYKAHGNGDMTVGMLGAGAWLVSLIGFTVGVRSFKQDQVFLGLPWFGVVGNAIIWIFLACLLLIGL
ncbi:MAG: hypothetical protein IJV71_00795 [Lachnospiraceae bacterium]|nr:hypothetical protein [Lachnospiraceae bacterium]